MDTYGHLIKENKYKAASRCTILSARNVDVNEISQKVDDLNEEICEVLLPEYLNSLPPNSLPPYKLRLRKYTRKKKYERCSDTATNNTQDTVRTTLIYIMQPYDTSNRYILFSIAVLSPE